MAATGATMSFGTLDDSSNRFAYLLVERGLQAGEPVVVFAGNIVEYGVVLWGAHKAGCFYTALATHLNAGEVGYIIRDSGAKAIVVDEPHRAVAEEALAEVGADIGIRLLIGGSAPGWETFSDALWAQGQQNLTGRPEGAEFLYSSGTTGHPKGIRTGLGNAVVSMVGERTDASDQVQMICSPLYHSAPLRNLMIANRDGAHVVILEKWDAEAFLAAVERYHVTFALMVPTHFIRLLNLPEDVREKYDLSSLTAIMHLGAPCPVSVKKTMMDWLGPILYEAYAGTENVGTLMIDPQEWLAHPGSVGRPVQGSVHILDADGVELPPGQSGSIWFDTGLRMEYHNDPEKTARAINDRGWSTLGDIGYVDSEGYVYLTDRREFMIVSGGVNIYPQEAENVLLQHPAVADVAVFGVPDPEFGEEVKAVVQPATYTGPKDPELEKELIDYCRSELSHVKCPRSIDFVPSLPRTDTGKLLKESLRSSYWSGATRIAH